MATMDARIDGACDAMACEWMDAMRCVDPRRAVVVVRDGWGDERRLTECAFVCF